MKRFISKRTNLDTENSETQVWLDFAKVCDYVKEEHCSNLKEKSLEIGKLF